MWLQVGDDAERRGDRPDGMQLLRRDEHACDPAYLVQNGVPATYQDVVFSHPKPVSVELVAGCPAGYDEPQAQQQIDAMIEVVEAGAAYQELVPLSQRPVGMVPGFDHERAWSPP